MAAGLLVRLYGIQRGLWEDEITAAYYTQLTPADVFDTLAQNGSHPPLYFLLTGLGVRHGLDVVAALRLPSLVAGTATIAVVYLIALKLAGRTAAVVAGLLATIAPMAVWYSQEGRMYALVWFFVLASYLVLAWGTESRAWALFALLHALFIGLALWTDYSAALALLPQPLLILLLKRRAWFLGTWATGWISILPWLAFLGRQYGRIQAQRFPGVGTDLGSWLGALGDLASVHATFATDASPLPAFAVVSLVALIGAAAGVTFYGAFRGRERMAALVVCLTLGPLAVALALAAHGTVAVVIARVLGIIAFGVVLMLAAAAAVLAALESRPPRAAGAVGLAAVLLLAGASEADVAQHGNNGTGWQVVAHTLDDDAQPGDELIYYPIATTFAVDQFLAPSSPFRTDYNGIWPAPDDVADQIFATWVLSKSRVWFVYLDTSGVDMPEHDMWFTGHSFCRVMGDPAEGSGIIEYQASTTPCRRA